MADLLKLNKAGTFSFRGRNSILLFLLPFAVLLFCVSETEAQELLPDNVAPPVMHLISKDEKTSLEGVTDVKERTKLAIELMETRLKKAETLNAEESYEKVLTELGSFEALMDNTLKFLNKNDNGRGRVLDTYKKFEIALRAFTPRIELIRREVPEQFEFHVRELLKNVRDARAKAVEPFFSSTVVPEEKNN